MPWWRRTDSDRSEGRDRRKPSGVERGTELGTVDARIPSGRNGSHDLMPFLRSAAPRAVSADRLAAALRRLDVYFLADPNAAGSGGLVAIWERHAVMFALEGPDRDILMVRARAHGTVPPVWADRAYAACNSWNHDRRFLKTYVGGAGESGQLPLYAEMQVPLVPGAHDQLLDELVGCAVDVAESWVDWLHSDGAVL
jgi:Putative bacterial sensory transduction regulator